MFYIYNVDTSEIIAELDTDNPDDFEFNYDWDLYGASQTKEGLI
jgi:hypothetical protein